MSTIVRGPTVDEQTRCVHYRTELDIVAIRFRCCGEYYPCFRCHGETTTHAVRTWPVEEHDQRAVLCGVCRHELTVTEYLASDRCPRCASVFNPGCRLHADLYFDRPSHSGPADAVESARADR